MSKKDDVSSRPEIKLGRYKHYKGNYYQVVDLVCHSETLEWLVLYKRLYDGNGPELWVRPYVMFTGIVTIDGKDTPRFRYADETGK